MVMLQLKMKLILTTVPNVVEPDSKLSKEEEGSSDDDEDSEGSGGEDDGSEEEDEPKTIKITVDVPSATKAPQTPAIGSKTLFVSNLSYSVGEIDILNFFKDAGEVVELRLSLRDGRFALELNNELLLDRAVRLDLAKEKGAYIPGNDRSSKRSEQSQVRPIRGVGTDDGFYDVKSSLEEQFGKCGEISRMAIPKDFESCASKRVACIDFIDSKAFSKALDLSGYELSGGTITV
ncbi:putative RNA recognition motif domain, nucleotide-binding alpha-beta plait domain superfamily [Helianthus annuus]|nr:putative RNA recognition motif domain, nucleotide-binding alpha-beta plait domain superfamily [Helianthus annuus]